MKKNIVLWCGSAANHRALANKIHKKFGISGIVIDKKRRDLNKRKKKSLFRKIYERIRFRSIDEAWNSLQKNYKSIYPNWPNVPIIEVQNINTSDAKTFTESLTPDLIVVSGTGLVKEPLITIDSTIGIINLHTGLSPYVKGGPNCTNWCIANNREELIGNTIMWINSGIDSGNIIVSEAVDIKDCESLKEVQKYVMEKAHELYLTSIHYLITAAPPHSSVPQISLGKGELFFTSMWTDQKKIDLLNNWKERSGRKKEQPPVTVNLPNHG